MSQKRTCKLNSDRASPGRNYGKEEEGQAISGSDRCKRARPRTSRPASEKIVVEKKKKPEKHKKTLSKLLNEKE